MTYRRALVPALLACACGGAALPPQGEPEPAEMPSHARAPAARRPADAVELGEAGDLATLLVSGDHVYWASREDGGAVVRRVPRRGGAVEDLARVGELGSFEPALAVVGDAVFATTVERALGDVRAEDAVVLRIADGEAHPFARARGMSSAGLVAHDRHLYWVATTATGPGVIVSTRVSDGRTRTLVPCPASGADCGELVPGTPPVAVILDYASRDPMLHALGPERPQRGTATVPVGLDALAVLGAHVLCAPVYAEGEVPRSTVLVPLAGGEAIAADGLDGNTLLVEGRYYHVTDAGLVRRTSPAGADELIAAHVQTFAASTDGLAWVEDGTVWAAPLPR